MIILQPIFIYRVFESLNVSFRGQKSPLEFTDHLKMAIQEKILKPLFFINAALT